MSLLETIVTLAALVAGVARVGASAAWWRKHVTMHAKVGITISLGEEERGKIDE